MGKTLMEILAPMVAIADAHGDQSELYNPVHRIIVHARGGEPLLTLQDCIDAREFIQSQAGRDARTGEWFEAYRKTIEEL